MRKFALQSVIADLMLPFFHLQLLKTLKRLGDLSMTVDILVVSTSQIDGYLLNELVTVNLFSTQSCARHHQRAP